MIETGRKGDWKERGESFTSTDSNKCVETGKLSEVCMMADRQNNVLFNNWHFTASETTITDIHRSHHQLEV